MPPCVATTVKISQLASSCSSDSHLIEYRPAGTVRGELIFAEELQRVDTAVPCYMFWPINMMLIRDHLKLLARKPSTRNLGFCLAHSVSCLTPHLSPSTWRPILYILYVQFKMLLCWGTCKSLLCSLSLIKDIVFIMLSWMLVLDEYHYCFM